MEIKTKREQLLDKYMSDALICVVDTSSVSRNRLFRILIELGAKAGNVKLFGKYVEAEKYIKEMRPLIVMTNYMLGKSSGFDLLQLHKKQNEGNKEALSLMITSDSSQSLVARAAEEDIDSFILKPYSVSSFYKTIMRTVMDKMYPTPYMKMIEHGKESLIKGEAQEAMKLFQQAKELHKRPTLACFYLGQAKLMLQAMSEAEGQYRQCLNMNKVHYKCLVSLFDLLYDMERYDDAYEIVRILAKFFPANPNRLATVVRLAIITANYDDINEYYDIFIELELRNDELYHYVCAAMIVCGRYYQQIGKEEKTLELYRKVGIIAGEYTKFLRIVVEDLVEFGLEDSIGDYLKRFDDDTRSTEDFTVVEFLATYKELKPTQVIMQAIDLIRGEIFNSGIYFVLIRNMVELSRTDQARTFRKEAKNRWPEKEKVFAKIA